MMYGFAITAGQLVAVPDEVEVIQHAYAFYAACGNQTAVARETGLSRDMVSAILRDNRYVEHGIISAADFAAVQAALAAHTNPYAVSVPREKRVQVQARFSLAALPPEPGPTGDPDLAADPVPAADMIQTIYDAIRPDEDGHTAMTRKEKRALMQYVERLNAGGTSTPSDVHSPENE